MRSSSSICCGCRQNASSIVRNQYVVNMSARCICTMVVSLRRSLLDCILCIVIRLFIWAFVAVPSIRQIYQYMTDPNCRRIGMTNIQTEVYIINSVTPILLYVSNGPICFVCVFRPPNLFDVRDIIDRSIGHHQVL